MSKEIKLPEEVADQIKIEAKEIIFRIEKAHKNLGLDLDWREQFERSVKIERAKAYFREQELLHEIKELRESLQRQVKG